MFTERGDANAPSRSLNSLRFCGSVVAEGGMKDYLLCGLWNLPPWRRPPPPQALFLFSCKHLPPGNEENTSLMFRIFVLNRCDLSLQSPPCPLLSLRSYNSSLKGAPVSGELPVFAQGDKGKASLGKAIGVPERSPRGCFVMYKSR